MRAYHARDRRGDRGVERADQPGRMLARVAGDALDIATLVPGLRHEDAPTNALVAWARCSATVLDILGARALSPMA